MNERWFRSLVALWGALHLSTLFGEIPEPDAALYANLAKRMAETGDWVNLVAYNTDWLDKPHLPFWVTAASFELFGVNVIAARLPALLCFALGVWATWKLALELFDRTVAQASVLMVLSAIHLLMSNGDTRAEPWLVGFLTTAVWLTIRVARAQSGWGRALVLASLCTAAAMMTKGPFVLIPIGSVAVIPALLRREPVRWGRWLLALALVAVFVTPELWCLYQQFDAHPEKVMFERQGVSGVRWFLWESQLGRFTNSGPIRGSGDPTFFLHTVLWAFLPWSVLLYLAGFSRLARWKERSNDVYLWSAAIPMALVFSASRFQLPHYLNIVYPFFAVAIAAWLERARASRAVSIAQSVVLVGTAGFLAWLLLTFDVPFAIGWVVLAFVSVIAAIALQRDLVLRTACAAWVMFALHQLVYTPATMRYQAGGAAAEVANARPPMRTVMLGAWSQAFAFHLRGNAEWWTDAEAPLLRKEPVRVLAPVGRLEALGFTATEVARFESFRVSMPTGAFLDSKRRPGVLETWVLAEVH